MIEFLRIETRGGNLVAVFDRGYRMPCYQYDNFDGRYATVKYDDGTFCLNENNLRARIANVEREGRSAAVERHALTTMTEIKRNAREFPDEV